MGVGLSYGPPMKHPTVLSRILCRLRGGSSADEGIRLFHLDHLRTQSRQRNEAVIRDLCANAYLGDGRSLCRALGRYKMIVDPTDVGLSSHLLLDGYWEMWLTELLTTLVRPGMVAVDIGANLGYFTLLMADLVGLDGHVHAFEPNADLARRARQSIAINGFDGIVTMHEQALGDTEADMLLMVPANEPKNGHLLAADHPPAAGVEGHAVRTRRLDSYAELANADLIKIDADTSEFAIWRGMAGLLASARPLTVVLEFARARYADPGSFVDAILAGGFTLAEITLEDGVRPTTREAILSAPLTEDVMLLLVR